MRIAVCMPVFGQDDLTRNVLNQIALESAYVDVYLCDNKGDFRYSERFRSEAHVKILPQSENLGWLRGSNEAWRTAVSSGIEYDAFVLLNNDVLLSPEFFKRLYSTREFAETGLVAPLYNGSRLVQRIDETSDAASFESRPRAHPAAVIDGTCMLIMPEVFDSIGYLAEDGFGSFGWGADVDYCIRARRAGFPIVVSEMAYLHHLGWVTAQELCEDYRIVAYQEYLSTMTQRYGRFWGRHMELNLRRKYHSARRTFIDSLFPERAIERRKRWLACQEIQKVPHPLGV